MRRRFTTPTHASCCATAQSCVHAAGTRTFHEICNSARSRTLSATLEELDGALVFLGGGARRERAEILAALRAGVDLARIQSILATRKFPDHVASRTNPCSYGNGRDRSA